MTTKTDNKKTQKDCILAIVAHNDDQLLGVGGTIKKYADQGIETYTYIFSYGETSHPHYRKKVIAKIREKESFKAAKILGDNVTYFGIDEGQFEKKFDPAVLKKIIKEKKPSKIFTHSPDDPHPDHKAVFSITKNTAEQLKFKGDLYTFDVWNLFSIKTREYPKLFVDISDTFEHKVKAFKEHRSQTSTKISIGWTMYMKAIFAGWKYHCKYAEVFYKISLNNKNGK